MYNRTMFKNRFLLVIVCFFAINSFGYTPSVVLRISNSLYYAYSENEGFAISKNFGNKWIKKNLGLPSKVVYPFTEEEFPKITYMAVDSKNTKRVAVLFPYGLYVTNDLGETWYKVPLNAPLTKRNYLTSVAICSTDYKRFLVGTSFNGIFETLDGGKTWRDLTYYKDALSKEFAMGAQFFEESCALLYNPTNPQIIYAAKPYGQGLFVCNKERKSWTKIDTPFTEDIKNIRNLPNSGEAPIFEFYTSDKKIYRYSVTSNIWFDRVIKLPKKLNCSIEEEKLNRIKRASNKTGLYIRSDYGSGKKYEDRLNLIKEKGMNSFVIDMKDDYGYLTYNSKLEYHNNAGHIRKRFNIEEMVNKAHKKGLYIIGRIVIFKDKQMYYQDNQKYAIWDKTTNRAWGHKKKSVDEETGEISYYQGEHWVDPFCEEIWDYNIAIAKELQSYGVDEIQLDYIRFPSDGPVSRAYYRNRKEGQSNIDALESFLRKLRKEITIPISTDLYGFNCYFRMGNWIGQNIDMVSNYVDVIAPMYYPSHFSRGFLYNKDYLAWSKFLYKSGCNRSASIVGDRAIIRPYIQAFLLPAEKWMSEKQYKQYLIEQLQGSKESKASGWSLWNNSQNYYMIEQPLEDYIN